MFWDDFYDRYCDWSESTLKTRISSLEDIGNGEDVVDVVLNITDEKVKVQLIRKAMKLGVVFSHDDFMNLDGELPDEVYTEVASYSGFSADNPYFDEYDFDWDDFYANCADLPEDMLLRCILRIRKFGDSDEVVEAILSLSLPADDKLYDRALSCGVKFTQEQLELMGREDIFFTDELNEFNNLTDEHINNFAEQVSRVEKKVAQKIDRINNPSKRKSGVGKAIAWGVAIGILKGLFGGKKKHNRRCNGDCASCPPHYGYRYGRWYYGHSHSSGCEFGGNKCDGGRD